MRGVQVLDCDGRRQLGVDTLVEEHRLEALWASMREERRDPWWKFW